MKAKISKDLIAKGELSDDGNRFTIKLESLSCESDVPLRMTGMLADFDFKCKCGEKFTYLKFDKDDMEMDSAKFLCHACGEWTSYMETNGNEQ